MLLACQLQSRSCLRTGRRLVSTGDQATGTRRERVGFYAVSTDPITFGHMDIVRRSGKIFDRVVLGIGVNPGKKYMLDHDERKAVSERAIATLGMQGRATVELYQGLTAEHAYRKGYTALVRGLRNGNDLNDELPLHAVQQQLRPELETVMLPCRAEFAQFSSSIFRQLVGNGGDGSSYAPLVSKEAAERRLLNRTLFGVVGGIATGKSSFSQRLVAQLAEQVEASVPVDERANFKPKRISLDEVGHYVLSREAVDPCFAECKRTVNEAFGGDLICTSSEDGSAWIDRPKLAARVFAHPPLLDHLTELMKGAMMARLYHVLGTAPGIVIVEGAVLLERGWGHLVNNNVIFVDSARDVQIQRLVERHGDRSEAQRRVAAQITAEDRRELHRQFVEREGWGRAAHYTTDNGPPPPVDSIARGLIALHASRQPWLHQELP